MLFFFICLYSLSCFAFTAEQRPLLCDTHTPPPPWNCFNHAACLIFLTSLLHFTHCASPFFFVNSQVIYLCSVSVCSVCVARLCQEMKATQNGTRKWSTFLIAQLCPAAAKVSCMLNVAERQMKPAFTSALALTVEVNVSLLNNDDKNSKDFQQSFELC